jgi:hypothetical protein
VAIGGTLALALAIAATVTVIGLHYLHFKVFKPEPLLAAGTLYDLLDPGLGLRLSAATRD